MIVKLLHIYNDGLWRVYILHGVFNEPSGDLQLCSWWQNWYFWWEVKTSPAVFVATKFGVFNKSSGQFPAMFVVTKFFFLLARSWDISGRVNGRNVHGNIYSGEWAGSCCTLNSTLWKVQQGFFCLISLLIDELEMIGEKWPSQFPLAHGDDIKLLVLSWPTLQIVKVFSRAWMIFDRFLGLHWFNEVKIKYIYQPTHMLFAADTTMWLSSTES